MKFFQFTQLSNHFRHWKKIAGIERERALRAKIASWLKKLQAKIYHDKLVAFYQWNYNARKA